MIFWVIILIIIVFIAWLLITPLVININTLEKQYFISLKGLFKLKLEFTGDFFKIRIWTPVWTSLIDPQEPKKKKPKKEKKEKKKKKKKRKTPQENLTLINVILKIMKLTFNSFELKRLSANLDTENYVLNAQLIPVFGFINKGNINLNINFTGNYSLILILQNRIGKFVIIGLKFLYFYKIKK